MTQAIAAFEARAVEMFNGYFSKSEDEQNAMTAEYQTVIQPALLAHYGAAELASIVDPWMFDAYTDLYKDRNGFRPRGHSYAAMKSYMDNLPPLEDDCDDVSEDDDLGTKIDAYYSFDSRTEEELRDYQDVYGVSGHLFAASALRSVGAAAEEF